MLTRAAFRAASVVMGTEKSRQSYGVRREERNVKVHCKQCAARARYSSPYSCPGVPMSRPLRRWPRFFLAPRPQRHPFLRQRPPKQARLHPLGSPLPLLHHHPFPPPRPLQFPRPRPLRPRRPQPRRRPCRLQHPRLHPLGSPLPLLHHHPFPPPRPLQFPRPRPLRPRRPQPRRRPCRLQYPRLQPHAHQGPPCSRRNLTLSL